MPSDDPRRKLIADENRHCMTPHPDDVAFLLGELAEAEATIATQADEIERLTGLAYFGEHHFSDLTWKARCEEQAKEIERLRKIESRVRELEAQGWGILND